MEDPVEDGESIDVVIAIRRILEPSPIFHLPGRATALGGVDRVGGVGGGAPADSKFSDRFISSC